MKRMLTVAVLFAALLPTACIDTTGIDDTSAYLEEVLESLQVDRIVCHPVALLVDSAGAIAALNVNGVQLSYEGFNAVILSNDSPAVIALDLAGAFTALAAGQANIVARGPKNSTASCSITVT